MSWRFAPASEPGLSFARKQCGDRAARPERRPCPERLRQPVGDDPERGGVEAEPDMGAAHFHIFAMGAFRLPARPPGDDAVGVGASVMLSCQGGESPTDVKS